MLESVIVSTSKRVSSRSGDVAMSRTRLDDIALWILMTLIALTPLLIE